MKGEHESLFHVSFLGDFEIPNGLPDIIQENRSTDVGQGPAGNVATDTSFSEGHTARVVSSPHVDVSNQRAVVVITVVPVVVIEAGLFPVPVNEELGLLLRSWRWFKSLLSLSRDLSFSRDLSLSGGFTLCRGCLWGRFFVTGHIVVQRVGERE